MNTTRLLRLSLPVAFLITLALAFCFVHPVFAQDDTTPVETPVEAPAADPAVLEAPAETPGVDPAVITQEALAEAPVETPAELPAEEPPAEEQEPAAPELVLVDSTGEPLSMASQEAANILGGDPYFIAGGVYYGFSTTGVCPSIVLPANCTMSATPIQAAINDFAARHATGAITVEAGTYTETLIQINGITGLTGLIGAGSDATTGSIFSGATQIVINNQAAAFTLKGFRIANGNNNGALVSANNNIGTLTLDDLYLHNLHANGDAIMVFNQTGAVNLINVQADRNGNLGATISATGNVTITNSSFDANSGDYALNINSSAGSITLDGVSASDNTAGDGARLISKTGITIRNSMFRENTDGVVDNAAGRGLWVNPANRGPVLIQNSYFNDNPGEVGLFIYTLSGAVTLNSIQAQRNFQGIFINTCQWTGSVCAGSGALTITNSLFDANTNYNLQAGINGAITLTNVSASGSTAGYGAWLTNHYSVVAYAITVNNGTFSENRGTGLKIETRGAVTLNHVVASDNSLGTSSGIYIDNSSGTAGVSLLATLGQNRTNSNAAYGMKILSRGLVTINNLHSWYNGQRNLDIDNSTGTGGVTITTADFNRSVGENLYVHSNGAISLTDVTANFAFSATGAFLDNIASPSHAGVTVKNSVFSINNITGLLINTTGPVTLINVSARNNAIEHGVSIYATGTGAVSVTGSNFDNNAHYGLLIASHGSITIKDVEGQSNGWDAFFLDNSGAASAPVAITNIYVIFNTGTSLQVTSKGAVTITGINVYNQAGGTSGAVNISTLGSVTINNIGQHGTIDSNNGRNLTISAQGSVSINNLYCTSSLTDQGASISTAPGTGSVTITNSAFNHNFSDGLVVVSKGNITLTSVTAYGNINGYGANLDNSSGIGSITVGGTSLLPSTFSYNESYGLTLNSHGAVTLSNVHAEENHDAGSTVGYGIDLSTGNVTNVTLTNVWVNNHPGDGLTINCTGTVTGTGVYAGSNNGTQIAINNTFAAPTTPRTVTLTGVSINSGANSGLWVQSDGAITIKGINIGTQTAGYGARLNNITGSTTAGVTVTGVSATQHGYISYTGMDGLYISTHGPVTISNLDINTCHGNGMTIDQTTGAGAVSLLNVLAYHNDNHGIYITALGPVSLNNVTGDYNGLITTAGTGVTIDNHLGTGTVTVTASRFSNNYQSGLYILSARAVTLTGIIAKENSNGMGIFVRNDYGSGNVSMLPSTVLPNALYNNHNDNFRIISAGEVSISGLSTQGGGINDGLYIDNTAGSGKKVTLLNVDAAGFHTGNGVYIRSHGAISITNTHSNYNYTGMDLDNRGGPVSPVSIITSETISNNYTGISLYTNGNVALSRVTVFDNMNLGANIILTSAPTATVMVDRSSFNANKYCGLCIVGGGNVTLNGITANDNYTNTYGVTVDNRGGGSTGSVSLLTTLGANTMSGNTWSGFYVRTNGAVIVNNLTASNNGEHGLVVDNHTGPGTVTLTAGVYNQNVLDGIYIISDSPVTISNVQVFDNAMTTEGSGIYVQTTGDAVLIQNSQITGNARYGIYANINAVLTVKKCLYFGNNRQTPLDNDANIYLLGSTTLVVIR